MLEVLVEMFDVFVEIFDVFVEMFDVFVAMSPKSTLASGNVIVLVVEVAILDISKVAFFVASVLSTTLGVEIVGVVRVLLVRVLVELVVIIVPSTSVTSPSGIVRVLVLPPVMPVRSKSSFFVAVVESLNTGAVIVGALVPAFVAMLVRVVSTLEKLGIAKTPPEAIVVVP